MNTLKAKQILISLANQLDAEDKPEQADVIDKNFKEFLELLEKGELDFDFTFPSGSRDPMQQRSNFGRELTLSGIPGPQ